MYLFCWNSYYAKNVVDINCSFWYWHGEAFVIKGIEGFFWVCMPQKLTNFPNRICILNCKFWEENRGFMQSFSKHNWHSKLQILRWFYVVWPEDLCNVISQYIVIITRTSTTQKEYFVFRLVFWWNDVLSSQ